MSRTETNFRQKSTFPEIVAGMEKVEEEGEKQVEWLSPDGKYRVVLTIMGGGKEWDGVWLKDIRLLLVNKVVGSELMRVQYIKRADKKEIETYIYTDVLKVVIKNWYFTSYGYSSVTGGQKELIGANRLPNINNKMTLEDCIEAVNVEPVRFESDLPEKIDVEETVRLFLEQLEERSFHLPILIEV